MNSEIFKLKDELRQLCSIKHKTSPGRRITKIERRIGEIKKLIKEESMKNFNEGEAVKKLQSNRVKVENKVIFVKSNIGLKLLAYVDFLVNHCGYRKK